MTQLPDIKSIPPDLFTPPVVAGLPAPGVRVRGTTRGWEGNAVHHTLYLPRNWRPNGKFPVIVEYAGNLHTGDYGDECEGSVEGSNLGFGLTRGDDYIWICMPFVQVDERTKRNSLTWWGDVDETQRYCLATVRDICAAYGGDEENVVLCGFSRGAIACNYIGLGNEEMAGMWKGFLCHSHYDGVRAWPYPASDPAAARARLLRLRGRAQFISAEGSTAETRRYLAGTGIQAPFTFAELPFRNHTESWVLRDCALRRQARAWLHGLTAASSGHGLGSCHP